MTTTTLLAFLPIIVVVLPILAYPLIQRFFHRRRSVDDIIDFLQETNENAHDIAGTLEPHTQEKLKAESINDICDSEVCYRRDVLGRIDRMRDFFWRLRRNAVTLNEYGQTEWDDNNSFIRQSSVEARQKLRELVQDFLRAVQAPLQDSREARERASVLIRACDEFLRVIRIPLPNSAEAEARLHILSASSEALIAAVQIPSGSAEARESLEDLLQGFAQFPSMVPAVRYQQAIARLHELRQSTDQFIRIVRFPLLRLEIWSRVPLDRWTFIPVPDLASFGQSGDVDILEAYQRVKMAATGTITLLHPGGDGIVEKVRSKM